MDPQLFDTIPVISAVIVFWPSECIVHALSFSICRTAKNEGIFSLNKADLIRTLKISQLLRRVKKLQTLMYA